MQNINYKKKYISIYIWQTLSILLGFSSLFVVIPYLSSNKILYGIYSVCTSLTVFFTYADLGFVSAGVKYAAEYFIRGERDKEINMMGFVSFLMLIAFSFISLVILIFAIFPTFLIPELIVDTEQWQLARWLLLVLALSCPIIIGQRILLMIFTIRVEDYKYQKISLVGSLIKILSVFYFFREGHYELLDYYVFFQFVNLCIVIVAFIYIRNYGYTISDFLKSIRFNKVAFNKTKKLSLAAFVGAMAMILYYELDQIVIANYLGINAVAIYAISLSIMTFVRTFMSLLYSPYSARYNHYAGMGDMIGLQRFTQKVILELSPIVCSSIVILSCLALPFVISWVGETYQESARLVSFMVLSFIPNFISIPSSSYFLAKEENMRLIKLNIVNVLIYWVGISLTICLWGIYAFALFKTIAPFLVVCGYFVLLKNDFNAQHQSFISLGRLIKSLAFPIVVAIILSLLTRNYMCYIHSREALGWNLFLMSSCVGVSMLVLFFSNKQVNASVKSLLNKPN